MPRADVTAAYDDRAEEYLELFGSVERMAEQDRTTIERWRDRVRGPILDAVCGPGHWSHLMSEDGRRVVLGVDGSARFIDSARRRFPGIGFTLGDLAALPVASGSIGGVLAWFSVIHTAPAAVPTVLREFARILTPGGSVLLGYFDGDPGAAFGHAVATAYYWSADALGDLLAAHGLAPERSASRQDEGGRRIGHIIANA